MYSLPNTLNGTFGKGGHPHTTWGGGGSGGYFGGGAGGVNHNIIGGGSGGSSFISGHPNCIAIEKTSLENNIIFKNSSIHYSELTFINPIILSGNENFFSPFSTIYETGHVGDGSIVITFLSSLSLKSCKCSIFHLRFLLSHILIFLS
jgi:hypothetical protein